MVWYKKSFMFSLQTSNHLLGPKPFPLDRLLAILYSIVDSRVAPTANIFSQVASSWGLPAISQFFRWCGWCKSVNVSI